jgi:hypothetical protein
MHILLFLALIGFALSATAHIATFFNIIPSWEWLADIGIFVVFPIGLLVSLYAFKADSAGEFQKAISRKVPRVALLIVPLMIYAALNFCIVVFYLNEGGVPSRGDDGFVLRNHGIIIRHLTEAEYYRHKRYEARLSSGHDMFFYCFAGVTICAAQRQIRSTASDNDVTDLKRVRDQNDS